MSAQTRLVTRRKFRVHHQAGRGKRPEIEIMEPRILLSKDLIGSARERWHAAPPAHAAAAPGRIATPDAALTGHAAHARPVRSETAYTLPGAAGQSVEVTFTLTERQAAYHNEVGLFLVDDATGRIGSRRPGDRGYAAAALGRRQIVFTRDQRPGAVTRLDLPGGVYFGTYLIQNGSSERFMTRNPHDRLGRRPMAFFSFSAADPDHFQHLHERSGGTLRWEDLTRGGDRDFNDAVVQTATWILPSLTLQLDRSTDSEPVGDNQTDFATVTLVGQTNPNLPVTLLETGATTTADGSGRFAFEGVALPEGMTTFHVQVVDSRNHTAVADTTITRPRSTGPTHQGSLEIKAALARDTAPDGLTNTDGITSDPTVAGTVKGDYPIVSLLAGFDSTSPGSFVDVTADLGPDRAFRFDPTLLDQINGTALSDGPHTLHLKATDQPPDAPQRSVTADLPFVLDTQAPTVTIQQPPPGSAVDHNVTVVGTVTDQTSSVFRLEDQVDQGALSGISFDSSGSFRSTTTLPLDGSADGLRTVGFVATDLAGNVSNPVPFTFTLNTCGFLNGLDGWTTAQTGGTDAGKGTITLAPDHDGDNGALLREGDSFNVTLSKTFTVSQNPGSLEFEYENLNFDTAAPNMIKDAFEVALVDASGQPLVHTFAANRDAFFNIADGVPAAGGSETTINGQTVTLDLSGVTPGTQATLVFRLVNNDTDQNTSVLVSCARIMPGAGSPHPAIQTAGISPALVATAPNPTTASSPGTAALAAPVQGVVAATSQLAATSGGNGTLQAQSQSISVAVGYADDLRPSPYFPQPWNGSPNTIFVGSTSPLDAGAILIVNNSSSSITVDDVTVTLPGNLHFDLWGSHVVPAGGNLVLTQTTQYDFDTSDGGTLPFPQTYPDGETDHAAHIDITVNGEKLPTFLDTGHVLTTGGSDLAAGGANESLNWRPISTTGVGDPAGQPYTVQVDAHVPGPQLPSGAPVVLSGHAESVRIDKAATRRIVAVTVNGVPVDALDALGNFFIKLPIAPGENVENIVATDTQGTTGNTSLTVEGVSSPAANVDFSTLSDITASFRPGYARTSFQDNAHVLYSDVAIQNAGQYPVDAPLYVGVTNISDPNVRVVNPAGVTPAGVPYVDFTGLVTGGRLSPGGTTGHLNLAFTDPARGQFTYDLDFFGLLNRAPEFTTVPVIDAAVGRTYTYAAGATDPDHDPLRFALQVGPDGMQFDATTGKFTWSPTTADLGNHDVTLRVEDGRGGFAEQHYVVSVTNPPPNRPPYFTSVPVVDANVNTAYTYQATATDPDGDPLTFAVTSGPAGLQIDPHSGLVSWTPTYQQLGSQDVSLTVTDGQNGTVTQSYTILVQQEPGNHPPVIISQPVTTYSTAVSSSGTPTGPAPSDGLALTSAGVAAGFTLTEFASGFATDGSNGPIGITFPSGGGVLVTDHPGNLRRFTTDADGQDAGPLGIKSYNAADAMGLAQAGGAIYMTELNSGKVLQIDATGNVLQVVATGLSRAVGIVANPTDGHLFVSCGAPTNTIYDIDPATQTSTLFLNTPDPDGLSITPDGSVLYVAVRGADGGGHIIGYNTITKAQVFDSGPINSVDGTALGEGSLSGYIFANTNDGRVVQVSLATNASGGHDIVVIAQGGTRGDFVAADPNNGTLLLTQTSSIVRLHPPVGGGFGAPPPYSYPVKAIDPDGDPLVFSLPVHPDGMSIDPSSGQITWSPADPTAGQYPVTVRVDDGRGGFDTQSFTIDVSSAAPGEIRGSVFDDRGGDGVRDRQIIENGDFEAGNRSFSTAYSYSHGNINGFQTYDILRDPRDSHAQATSFGDHTSGSGLMMALNGPLSATDLTVWAQTVPVTPGTTYGFSIWVASWTTGPSSGQALLEFSIDGQSLGTLQADTTAGVWHPFTAMWDSGAHDSAAIRVVDLTAAPDKLNDFAIDDVALGSSDPGLSAWTLYLDQNQNGRLDPGEPSTTTDQDGNYAFTSLPAGAYTVAEVPQPGWIQTAPSGGTYQVTVGAGQVVTGIDFGNQQVSGPPVNHPPHFATSAPTSASPGQRLRYDAHAIDADNDPLTYDLVVKPAGMAVDPRTGTVIWTPTPDQVGPQSVTLRVQDGKGGVDIQSWTTQVSQANAPPSITSRPKGPAVVGVTWYYQVTAQDAEGDPIHFGLGAHPDGMGIDEKTGLVTWTPASNQAGSPHVEVTAIDIHNASTTQSFDLPVVAAAADNPPVFHSTAPASVRLGSTYLYQVVATDPDGDKLHYALTGQPDGMSIDPDTGLVTWKPTATQVGLHDNISVSVDDGRGQSTNQPPFGVTVLAQTTNHPPSIVSNPPFAAIVGKGYAYDATANDPDNDPLVWSLDAAPVGMSLDPHLGTIRWTPTADQIGSQPVVVRATDPQGAYATQSYSVAVRGVDLPPTIDSTPPTQAYKGEEYIYAVRATDPENDSLTFQLTTKPAGMKIDTQTGFIDWTPGDTQVGSFDVAIVVDDGQGETATQTYTVVVSDAASNLPPVITSTPGFGATVDQAYTYQVTARDPEGQDLNYVLLVKPDGMDIDPKTGLVTWTPGSAQLGANKVVVGAVDPLGAGGSQSYTITVETANAPPVVDPIADQTVTAGLPFRYDVRATDPEGQDLFYALDATSEGAGLIIDGLGRMGWQTGIGDIGSHPVTVTVTDARGASTTQTFTLNVQADTEAPRVSLIVNPTTVRLGDPITVFASATDNVGVVGRAVKVNDVAVPLDANGNVTLPGLGPGVYTVVATATDAAGNVGQAGPTTLTILGVANDTDAPVVALTAPADGSTITAPVDVTGTAKDDNLVDYTLSVAAMGSDTFTEFFRGTQSVDGGVLGKFDPTGLANGTYTLRLTATDAGGNVSSIDTTVNVAGDLKIGNFTLSFTDLSIPVSGIPVTLTRTYDSLNAGNQDGLGYGWRLEYRDADLRTSLVAMTPDEQEAGIFNPFRDKTRVYITLPGGQRQGFTFQPQRKSGFGGIFFSSPAFVPDAGVTSQLSVPDATLIQNDEGDWYGANDLPYNPADSLNWGGVYYLTTKDGLAYTIDANTGQVNAISDANGNALSFTDTSIDSNRGAHITFDLDPQGRIIAAHDPMGDTVKYHYDAQGDLDQVTDRAGNVTKFVYDDAKHPHFLTQVIDPLGRQGVRTAYDDQGRLITLIDAAGKTVQLAHDPNDSIETVTDALGNPTTYEYDERGNVVKEVDAGGGITTRTYDTANNMLTETDPLGHTTTYTYDGDGNVLTTTDAMGNVTRNTYIATPRPGLLDRVRGARSLTLLTSTTDALGRTTKNTYDGAGNLLSTTDAAGNTTTYTYDAAGNQTSITNAMGHKTTFVYDGSGHLMSQTDALGHTTTYTYDANGNQLTQTTTLTTPTGVRTLVTSTAYDANGRPIATIDAEGHTTKTEYDADGHQTATIDALGHRTTFVYDARGQLVETNFPDGTKNTTTYDAAGHRITSTDQAGRTTGYKYDPLGRLIETDNPDGTKTTTTYDDAGEVIAQTDELGHATTFQYDAAGRQTAVIDALNNKTTTAYDAAGQRISTTDPLGHTTGFVYDAAGRLVETDFADGTKTTTTYDTLGRSIAQTDQMGRVTHYEYDALGRLTDAVDALNQTTSYASDEAGDLVTQTDANGHVTTYEYDGLGRRIATVLPMGQRSTTTYDAAGNVKSTTDFNGQKITDDYDANNRLIAQHFPDGTSITFTYTATGQRQKVTDARGVTTYAYDARDRLISRTDPDVTKISYTYDAAGNRTSVTIPAGTTSYTFDAMNRTSTVTDPDGSVTKYTYDAAGNLVRTEFPNGTSETRQYDTVNHLTKLENDGPSGIISSYTYSLAKTGRRDAVLEDTGRKVQYQYDALDRLIEELITESDGTTRKMDYTYDNVGNRLTLTDTAQGETDYTYDANDRLLTETTGGVVTTYTYDNNGNTLSKFTSAVDQALYQWDAQNRMVGAKVTDSAGTSNIAYKYDADGIRVASIVNGAETRYLIDTVQPYAEVLEEYMPGGVNQVSYVYGNDLISQKRGQAKSFYAVDGLGSTRALTDAKGKVTDRYVYDAFGRTLGVVGTTGNSYLFTGEQRDSNVGLDYLRARYLSAGAGRFLSSDRFEGNRGTPISLNKYSYADANPTNATDPLGLFTLADALATVTIYGIVSSIGFGIANSAFKHRSNAFTPDAVAYGVSVTVGANISTTSLLPLIPIIPILGSPEFGALARQLLSAPTTSIGGTFGAEVLASARTLQVAEYGYGGYTATLLGGTGITFTAYEAIIYDLPTINDYKGIFNTISVGIPVGGNAQLVFGAFGDTSLGVNGYFVGGSYSLSLSASSLVNASFSHVTYTSPLLIGSGVDAVQKYFIGAVPPAGVLLSLKAHGLY